MDAAEQLEGGPWWIDGSYTDGCQLATNGMTTTISHTTILQRETTDKQG
jgi:hypothetical protein